MIIVRELSSGKKSRDTFVHSLIQKEPEMGYLVDGLTRLLKV